MKDSDLTAIYDVLYMHFVQPRGFMDYLEQNLQIRAEDMQTLEQAFEKIHQQWQEQSEVPRHIIQLLSRVLPRLSDCMQSHPDHPLLKIVYRKLDRWIESIFLEGPRLTEAEARVIVEQQFVGLGSITNELRHYQGLHENKFNSLLESLSVLEPLDQSKEYIPKYTAHTIIQMPWVLFSFQAVYKNDRREENIISAIESFDVLADQYLFGKNKHYC